VQSSRFLSYHDELIDILVHETNRYAEQYITSAILGPESE